MHFFDAESRCPPVQTKYAFLIPSLNPFSHGVDGDVFRKSLGRRRAGDVNRWKSRYPPTKVIGFFFRPSRQVSYFVEEGRWSLLRPALFHLVCSMPISCFFLGPISLPSVPFDDLFPLFFPPLPLFRKDQPHKKLPSLLLWTVRGKKRNFVLLHSVLLPPPPFR